MLQGFNATLTMLDGRAGGASSGGDFDETSEYGGGSAPVQRERKPAMAGAGGGRRGDMDDEIPF